MVQAMTSDHSIVVPRVRILVQNEFFLALKRKLMKHFQVANQFISIQALLLVESTKDYKTIKDSGHIC